MADEDENKKEGKDGEDESPEGRVQKAEKSARTKLILGLVLGAIVGGTAAFFGAMEMNKTAKEKPAVEEVAEEEPEDDISYEHLDIKRLPVALTNKKGQSIGYYFLDLKLSMTSLSDMNYVAERLPFVQETINKDIAYYGISQKDDRGIIDYENLPERLRVAINKMLGSERVIVVSIVKVSPGQ